MHILVAEDEVSLARAIQRILERKGYFVDVVHNGLDAVDYASNFKYDLIILDVMMPKLDGFQALQAIRSAKNSVPVLMLTARAAVGDKVSGLNYGADDYMTKPFDTEELLARVAALTRRTGALTLNEISVADLKLDLDAGLLSCGDQSVQLSKKELDVARTFLQNPTMTIAKETLIVNVWGVESDATDNNVEAYISFLRKKLKFLGSKVGIKNIQKIGYRLEVAE